MTTGQQQPATTTDAGVPVESDEHSLTVGPGGPILLQDSYLIEQMAQFNRERIPEREPRGFALKFYTPEGNYDMVGNNTPVFFVKDPMKFQHFIRSQKRRADNNLRDHDMQWDFWTLSPESAHQVAWLFGDRGIPRSWRNMNGYSSHTYM